MVGQLGTYQTPNSKFPARLFFCLSVAKGNHSVIHRLYQDYACE
jgi:hypothetical protein